MSDDAYHSDFSRASKTMLGHFVDSTQDFHDFYVGQTRQPPGATARMNVGSVVHEVLLERKRIDDVCVLYSSDCFKSNGALNPKPARQFEADHPNQYALKADDYAQCQAICDAVRRHDLGVLIGSPVATFEQPVTWECPETGLQCRCKPDFFFDNGDHITAYDLKTTSDIYPAGFSRIARRYKYWLQDAHYSAGLAAVTGKPVLFKFWCVETSAPYRIAPREYDVRSREIARDAYLAIMRRLAECYDTRHWADDWTQQTTFLTLGPWDVEQAEETELEGFEDVAAT